eukprot:COSAG05_NODE_226_length_13453_cov_12.522315_4_plen_174_part_00
MFGLLKARSDSGGLSATEFPQTSEILFMCEHKAVQCSDAACKYVCSRFFFFCVGYPHDFQKFMGVPPPQMSFPPMFLGGLRRVNRRLPHLLVLGGVTEGGSRGGGSDRDTPSCRRLLHSKKYSAQTSQSRTVQRAPRRARGPTTLAPAPLSARSVDQSLNGPSDSIGHAWIYA